jgi:hypothetical protein
LGKKNIRIFLREGLDRSIGDLPDEAGQELGFFEN